MWSSTTDNSTQWVQCDDCRQMVCEHSNSVRKCKLQLVFFIQRIVGTCPVFVRRQKHSADSGVRAAGRLFRGGADVVITPVCGIGPKAPYEHLGS